MRRRECNVGHPCCRGSSPRSAKSMRRIARLQSSQSTITVRPRLPHRPRSDLRESRWVAAEAGFDLRHGVFKRLKIPKPKGSSLHLLRHTMASQMLDGGVPLPVVSQRLGHSSVRVTADIYSHAIHGQDDEAVRRWEEYQKRNRPPKPENWKGDVQLVLRATARHSRCDRPQHTVHGLGGLEHARHVRIEHHRNGSGRDPCCEPVGFRLRVIETVLGSKSLHALRLGSSLRGVLHNPVVLSSSRGER